MWLLCGVLLLLSPADTASGHGVTLNFDLDQLHAFFTTRDLRSYPTARTTLFVDTRLADSSARAWVKAADASVSKVEDYFHHSFAQVPPVYLVGDDVRYRDLLEAHFRQTPSAALELSRTSGGVSFGELGVIVNWSRWGDSSDFDILRHELTHAFLSERFGYAALPRWFDEGLATVAGADQARIARSHYTLGALLYQKQIPDLRVLTNGAGWTQQATVPGTFLYDVAGAAALLYLTWAPESLSAALSEPRQLTLLQMQLSSFATQFPTLSKGELAFYR